MDPVRRGYPLQTRGFSGAGVALRFPGFHREFTGVWAPNGHPSWPSPGPGSLRLPHKLRGEQMSETGSVATYVDAENQVLSASNGVDYAYRSAGASDATPLVMLQHFRGNLDNWDPALIDTPARGRRVITFDNRGVAGSSGTTPSTIAEMALDRSISSMRLASGRSICSGSRLAASWPRRSLSFARRSCAT
jgi:hypothetical protein